MRAGQPRVGGGPGGHQIAFRLRHAHDLRHAVQLVVRQRRQDLDRAAVNETGRLSPVLLGSQRLQVTQTVGDHQGGHAALPVEAGQRVGVLDQAGRAAQGPPQLVHHRQVAAPRRESPVGGHRGRVNQPEPVAPGAQHRRGDQSVAGGGDVADVHRHRRGGQIDRAGGRPVEHPLEAALAQQAERERQPVDALVVVAGAGGPGGGAQLVGPLLEHGEDVRDGRVAVGEPLGGQVHRTAQHHLLLVVHGVAADQRAQRQQQRQPPSPDLQAQLVGPHTPQLRQHLPHRPGVKGIDPVHAPADPHDLPAQVVHQAGVVRFGVA